MKHIYTILCFALTLTGFSQELVSYVDFGASSPQVHKSRIAVDGSGNIIHANYIHESLDADPGAGVHMVNPDGVYGIVITKFDADLNFLWANFFEFTSYYWMDIECDAEGNIYFNGTLAGTSDLDPGPDYAFYTSQGWQDPVVIKFAPDGDFVWASILHSVGSDSVYDLAVLPDGSSVSVGYASGTIDFDPGPGEQIVVTDEFDYFGFICQLNPDGSLAWAAGNPESGINDVMYVTSDSQGNILTRGSFSGDADFDDGPGEYLVSGEEISNDFVASYSPEGAINWAFRLGIGSGFSEDAELIQTDTEDNIIISGIMFGEVDFDPSESVATSNSGFNSHGYLAKYSPEGAYLWHRSFAQLTNHNLVCGPDNSIYVASMASSDSDADGGLGTYQINVDGQQQIALLRYSSNGDFQEGFSLYTGDIFDSGDWTTNIALRNEQIIVTGLYQDILDLDPQAGEVLLEAAPSTWPAFIAIYEQSPCATVTMTLDELESISCSDISGLASATFISGASPYAYEWNTGETTSVIYPGTGGIYTVVGTEGSGCVEELSAVISGPQYIAGYDLNPNLVSGGYVPGFETSILIDAFNDGCEMVSGSLDLILDDFISFISAEPAPDVISGNTLTWYFSDLHYDGEHLTPLVYVSTPVDTELGEIVDLTVSMSPSGGDSNTSNNVKHYQYMVTGSFDPNDKQVYPQGDGPEGFIENNQTMTYTIRFQNTGTGPAVNVNILDVIDPELDLSTVQIIGASHEMYTEVLDGNTLRFAFPNIMLPDSGSNYEASMGYVIFTIDQQADLPAYTEITNSAAIYFDFNAPVITNTVLSTIGDYSSVNTIGENNTLIFPNPVRDSFRIITDNLAGGTYRITGSDGKLVETGVINSASPVISCEAISPGLYHLRIEAATGTQQLTFIKE